MNTTTQMPMVVLDAPADRFLGLSLGGLTGALTLVNILAGGALCVLRSELAVVWVAVMGFVPVAMVGLRLIPGGSAGACEARNQLQRTVIAAGVLILVPVLLRLVEALGVVEFSAASRSIGVTIGLGVLLASGYLARSTLGLLSARMGAVVAARVLGFASWGAMAGGLGYAVLWLIAPLEVASLWASCALGAALLLVAARSFVVMRLGNRRSVH